MAITLLIRKPRTTRSFHTSSSQRASVLFALGALSNSRETQHFNKLSRLERVEHSPPLKLIKTSEVDPFPLPEPSKIRKVVVQNLGRAHRTAGKIWDDKALKVGRTILADNARHVFRLSKSLERAKSRQSKADKVMERSLADWAAERRKMHAEMRQAGVWILAAVGTATGLAMWRFWPERAVERDSGELGRRIAERARGAMPLPAMAGGEGEVAAVVSPAVHSVPLAVASKGTQTEVQDVAGKGSWWQNVFWKKS